jgi:hypothetical protein
MSGCGKSGGEKRLGAAPGGPIVKEGPRAVNPIAPRSPTEVFYIARNQTRLRLTIRPRSIGRTTNQLTPALPHSRPRGRVKTKVPRGRAVMVAHMAWAQHLLYFLPEPQGHGSLRPTLMAMRPGLGRGPGLDDIKICLGPLWRQ